MPPPPLTQCPALIFYNWKEGRPIIPRENARARKQCLLQSCWMDRIKLWGLEGPADSSSILGKLRLQTHPTRLNFLNTYLAGGGYLSAGSMCISEGLTHSLSVGVSALRDAGHNFSSFNASLVPLTPGKYNSGPPASSPIVPEKEVPALLMRRSAWYKASPNFPSHISVSAGKS